MLCRERGGHLHQHMSRPFFRQPAHGGPRPDARQRVLAQWRGLDVSPLERAQADRSQSLSNLLPGVLTELGLERKRAEAEVMRVWNTLLDPNLVAHAQPTGLAKGTLFVTVDSSVWLSEIVRYQRKEILARLQLCFGKDLITRISFRTG